VIGVEKMRVIAVVGSGIAGDEAALAARKTDPKARVVMITRDPYPLYSACVLANYVSGEIPRERVFLRTPDDYTRDGIEILMSRQVVDWHPDRHVLCLDDEGELSYDRLIIATGSRPFIPPLPGVEKEGVVTLKTLRDADIMRDVQGKSAVVVGSGPIGIETAVALHRRGWSVSLVELLDRILPRLFDIPLASSLQERLESRGIQVFLREKVLEILGEERVSGVRTDQRTIPADLVILVIGMRPDLELAKKGELVLGVSGGIQVDEHMRTNRTDVWACGDCVESQDMVTGRKGLFMLWNNARIQGRVAGANAAGDTKRYPGSLNLTSVSFFGEACASVGLLSSDLSPTEAQVIHRKGLRREFWLVLQDNRIVGAQALGHTERVGGLVGLILRGEDLRKTIIKGSTRSERRRIWPLRGLRRDLLRLSNFQ